MPKSVDLATWSRRELFEFYRDFDKPYFNVCVRLDATNLVAALKEKAEAAGGSKPSISLAYHYFALRAANELEPFRFRLIGGQVIVYEIIHGGTTVLLPNGSFTLAYFDYIEDFWSFMEEARRAVDGARVDPAFRPRNDDQARIHFTTLPWVAFTSFSHARNWRQEDSVPKIAFGKFINENGRVLLPFSVEVHHALVDGSDVGRYLARLEEALAEPEKYLE